MLIITCAKCSHGNTRDDSDFHNTIASLPCDHCRKPLSVNLAFAPRVKLPYGSIEATGHRRAAVDGSAFAFYLDDRQIRDGAVTHAQVRRAAASGDLGVIGTLLFISCMSCDHVHQSTGWGLPEGILRFACERCRKPLSVDTDRIVHKRESDDPRRNGSAELYASSTVSPDRSVNYAYYLDSQGEDIMRSDPLGMLSPGDMAQAERQWENIERNVSMLLGSGSAQQGIPNEVTRLFGHTHVETFDTAEGGVTVAWIDAQVSGQNIVGIIGSLFGKNLAPGPELAASRLKDVQRRLADILKANPRANLHAFAPDLKIHVTQVDGPHPRPGKGSSDLFEAERMLNAMTAIAQIDAFYEANKDKFATPLSVKQSFEATINRHKRRILDAL